MSPDRAIRPDDAFDVDAVARHLGLEATPEVRQFSGGSSNLTYLLRLPDRELVLRRPPKGARSGTAHDMAREYHFQRRLKPYFPYAPEVIGLCEDEAVIGAPFYVMERVPGVVPGPVMPPEIGTDPERMAILGDRFVRVFS
jgi:aminoglycoside phosphotransferase (APT) family kinase protein